METLYVLRGTSIQRKDNTLRVTLEDGTRRSFPVQAMSHVVIPTSCRVTTDALALLSRAGVRVSLIDYYGRFCGSVEPAWPHASGEVHLAQARLIFDGKRRLDLARRLVDAGTQNCLSNLRYYLYRGRRELEPAIRRMEAIRKKFGEADSVEALMGYEGQMREEYYAAWEFIHPDLKIRKRTRRPPADRVNAMISFANGMVYSACRHELSKTHLDCTLSVLHAPTQARASLALDLAEVFKPVVADRAVFRLVTRGEMGAEDFEEHPGAVLLSQRGRAKLVDAIRETLDSTEVGGLTGYRAVILREAYRIEAHVLDMEEYEPFVRRA